MARALVLLSLILLPVQMRAGAMAAHPHSLLQLLVDASDDGRIDHHSPFGHVTPEHSLLQHQAPLCEHDPDIPSLEESGRAAGGTIALAAVAVLAPLAGAEAAPIWPIPSSRSGLLLPPDSPPPRWSYA